MSQQMTLQQAIELAQAHHQAGRLPAAESLYRQILQQQPGNATALHYLGLLHHQTGRSVAAVELMKQAIAADPSVAGFHCNLGTVQRALGQLDQALVSFQKAVELQPDYAEAYCGCGTILAVQGKRDEASRAFRQALVLNPDNADACFRLGKLLGEQGKLDEAVDCLQKATALRPGHAEAFKALSVQYKEQGRLDEAIACLRQALAAQPDYVKAHSSLLYLIHFHPGWNARQILEEHRLWARRFAEPLVREILPHSNDRLPDRRLKVGYVSAQFCWHSAAFFLLPLLECHDRRNIDITCYSGVRKPDDMTERMRRSCDGWRDTAGVTDADLATMIRKDQIDILVDLTLHMANCRLLTFARKPAPVQVTYLGYPSTTGLAAMDYRLTDPYLDPADPGRDQFYVEKSIRLPETWWAYRPPDGLPAVNELPALTTGHVTFGCFNSFLKINDKVLSLWAQVLGAVPGSRLALLAEPGSHREQTREAFARQGVEGERIQFAGRRPLMEYFNAYQQIDICLDPFPANGHTTTCDALWMGVPVVTLPGETAISRGALSLLVNAGLPELVAKTPGDYVRTVAGLAGDLPRLRDQRARLRDMLGRSPIMAEARFTRHLEACYRAMWHTWCERVD